MTSLLRLGNANTCNSWSRNLSLKTIIRVASSLNKIRCVVLSYTQSTRVSVGLKAKVNRPLSIMRDMTIIIMIRISGELRIRGKMTIMPLRKTTYGLSPKWLPNIMKCCMSPYLKRLYKVMKFESHWVTLGSETKIWGKMYITIHITLPPRMTNEVSIE